METMINYIHSIFKQFNYQNIGEEQDLIFMKHNLFHDYWILHTTTQFDLNSQLTIADKAQKAFEGIKEAENAGDTARVKDLKLIDTLLKSLPTYYTHNKKLIPSLEDMIAINLFQISEKAKEIAEEYKNDSTDRKKKK